MELRRPDGIDDTAWNGIQQCLLRLERAVRQHDLSLVVGSAKELAESVAKTVLDARGETVASAVDFPEAVNRTHTVLDRQPGVGLAADPLARDIAQASKNLVLKLGELRNRVGTGHGRATEPDVVEEHAFLCADGAVLWSAWALRRLEHLISGLPAILARDLTSGHVFHRGTLRSRLAQANLPALGEQDQRMLGKSVAQRAMQDTFVVREEGVEACARQPDLGLWPAAYRAGVVEGLFFDRAGYLDATPQLVREAALILLPMPEAKAVIESVAVQAGAAELSFRLSSDEGKLAAIRQAIAESAGLLHDEASSALWLALGEHFREHD